jgi:hypothetical protein
MNAPEKTELKIEIVLHRPPTDVAHLRSQLPALAASVTAAAEIVADKTLQSYKAEKQRMVEFFLQGATLQPLDVRKARMAAKAMQDIFSGTEWLTAEQVGAKGVTEGCTESTRKAGTNRVNRWKTEGKIFAIQRAGKDWYPRYQFNDDYAPIPVMSAIVQKFGDDSPIEIAAWMESPNNYLDAKRPREVIRSHRSALLATLEMHFGDAVAMKADVGS